MASTPLLNSRSIPREYFFEDFSGLRKAERKGSQKRRNIILGAICKKTVTSPN
jgi:hypothetical protein